ncbi:hypothetical protein WMY93_012393 [Mugilogobius chulae]|uniref:Uncharacterized protein n=1 Tax=Mugilogobius chulae TaxID=88201 RepID=A0AAW0P4X1_9GOBI
MENGREFAFTFYQHYKYYHFFAITFGLGCGLALYRPYRTLVVPSVLAVVFTIAFEIAGICFELPSHTSKCKGPPYNKRDVYWGFTFALFVAILHSNVYHVYTLSYGCGMMVFALRGAIRKYNALWEFWDRQRKWWYRR